MSTSLVESREGRLLRLTLNRPEKRNALNNELCQALVSAVRAAQEDRATGAILIDAAGSLFCAGMDLDEALAPDAAERTAIHQELFTIGAWSRVPIVVAVQGAALAGGLGLVANAHVLVAAHGAQFALTELRIGMWPFVIFPAMVRAVGRRRALELSLTARLFGATEAVAWGLVHEVVPPIELDDRATAIAMNIAHGPASAIRAGMDYVRRVDDLADDEAVRMAAALRADILRSPDFAEGVRAFREKRKPEWASLK